MATVAQPFQSQIPAERRFFLTMAIVMSVTILAGFSLQLGMGRSSFRSPLLVHAHAVVFMGWVALNLLQNALAARGSIALHKRLGWIGAAWVVVMVVFGCAVTIALVRGGRVPFFFMPVNFLVFDPLSIFTFAGLTAGAIALRRETEWHARLHYCAMSVLVGPGIGRLLPGPLLIPFAYEAVFAVLMIFPIVGVVRDWRRNGTVHPAWKWGVGVMLGSLVLTDAITYSPVGTALYDAITAGSPGAAIAPRGFPPFPGAAAPTAHP